MSLNTTPGGTIDPNSFTSDELLKHIYRSVQDLNSKMDQQERSYVEGKERQDGKLETLQNKYLVLQTQVNEKEKFFKNIITIITIGVSILSLGLSFAVYFLK